MKGLFTFAAVALSILISNAGAQTAASRTEPLKVGAIAPDFTLTDTNGKPVKLSAIKQPTVLVFYRGYW
jgi:cytochrome oxidase Cu insertion factor (SCO1/SenC/PrrC family)